MLAELMRNGFVKAGLSVLLLAGCSGASGDDLFASSSAQAEATCPRGQTLRYGHCVFVAAPDETVNATPQCHPVSAQVYLDWSLYGDGGAGAGWCASACHAICAGSDRDEQEARAEAATYGMACNC